MASSIVGGYFGFVWGISALVAEALNRSLLRITRMVSMNCAVTAAATLVIVCSPWAGLLTALAGKVLHDRARVAQGLDVALEAAEQEVCRRMFVAPGGGNPLRELLVHAAPGMDVYRLVASDLARIPPGSGPAASARPWPGSVLTEPLAERELTVLRYLQRDLSNVEIGSLLCISVNTIKTHVKNIYRKLSAARRREAVQRARELLLL